MAYRGETEIAVCPRCRETALEALVRGHARVLACKTCSGVFLEPSALEALARGDADVRSLADDAARAPPRPASPAPELACPRCGAMMARTAVPLARCEIDVCRVHGAWFDRWEAQSVARSVVDPAGAEDFRRALAGE